MKPNFIFLIMHQSMWHHRMGRMGNPWGFWDRQKIVSESPPCVKIPGSIPTFVWKFNVRIHHCPYYSLRQCQSPEGVEMSVRIPGLPPSPGYHIDWYINDDIINTIDGIRWPHWQTVKHRTIYFCMAVGVNTGVLGKFRKIMAIF